MRDLRHLPSPGALVEITQRTMQGRYLFRPSRRLNALVVGCLARAQKHTECRVHAVAALSTHFHLLASFDTVEQMAKFMCHLKTNLSKEVGRLYDWENSLFDGRYRSIPVSDECEAQEERLRYILSQGAKEGLVLSPRDWPGVHSANALADGESLRGIWIDRTRLYAARQRKGKVDEREFTVDEELKLAPLPCWEPISDQARRERVEVMLRQIERETLALHEKADTVPLGTTAIRRRQPHERPNRRPARSPKPRFHAASKHVRDRLVEGFREFVAAYRIAAERLVAGDRQVTFPENCFPPRLPFVEPAVGVRFT
ncbi:MAG: transposase [Acidobacteriota bacterium]